MGTENHLKVAPFPELVDPGLVCGLDLMSWMLLSERCLDILC